jgi:hypothetical protein
MSVATIIFRSTDYSVALPVEINVRELHDRDKIRPK